MVINGDYENLYNCSLKSPMIRRFLEMAINEEPGHAKSIRTEAKLLTTSSAARRNCTGARLGPHPAQEPSVRGSRMSTM